MSEIPEENLTPQQKSARTRKANAAKKSTKDRLPAEKRSISQDEPVKRPEETEGWHLMKSFDEIPVWDQTPLIQVFMDMQESQRKLTKAEFNALTPEEREEYNKSENTVDVSIIGKLALAIRPFAIDVEAYDKFCSGGRAMQRSMNLAMAWVGQMGEFGSSES